MGGVLYLVSVAILVGYHIPHNNQLMTVDPDSTSAGEIWSLFFSAWMIWNHARTFTALGGAIVLVFARRAR